MSNKSSDRFDGVLLGKLDCMITNRITMLYRKLKNNFLEFDDIVPLNYY